MEDSDAASASCCEHVERMINSISNHYKSPSRTIYSDRFIPSRSSSKFALFDISPSHSATSTPYTNLLRTALFGPDDDAPLTPDKRTPNIFRYKTETRPSLSSSPFNDHVLPASPSSETVKPPRKIPPSPFKVRFYPLPILI